MKKFIYAALALMLLSACEKEPTNPGDFNLQSSLRVNHVWTAQGGQQYDVRVVEERDTAYQSSYIDKETEETVWFATGRRGHYVRCEVITLESPADTVCIDLESNAKWYAPMPTDAKAQWFTTQNQSGGGNSTVRAVVTRNRNKTRAVSADQYILTADSAVMYHLVFSQKGEKDEQ